jgi:hypothetical protein
MASSTFEIIAGPGVLSLAAQTIADALALAGVCVSPDCIALWTDTERTAAVNWAYAVHYIASDNVLNEFCRAHDEDVEYDPPFRCICCPPKPEFLNCYGKTQLEIVEQNKPFLHDEVRLPLDPTRCIPEAENAVNRVCGKIGG